MDIKVTKKYDRRGGDSGEGDSELELLSGMRGTGVCATRRGLGYSPLMLRFKPMGVFWEKGRRNGVEAPRRSMEDPSPVTGRRPARKQVPLEQAQPRETQFQSE